MGGDFRGRVRYRRHFNRPSGLEPHERLWLVVEGVDAQGAVALNDHALGAVRGYALDAGFDVTALVRERNLVVLDVDLPRAEAGAVGPLRPGREHLPGGPVGLVRLEIRAGHFLDRLSLQITSAHGHAELGLRGWVAGEPPAGPLAIVVTRQERELLYVPVAAGRRFDLSAAVPDLPTWPAQTSAPALWSVEVKLLAGGAAVWQTQFETAVGQLQWDQTAKRLLVRDQCVAWPVPQVDFPEAQPPPQTLRRVLEKPGVAAIGSRRILPEAFYAWCDRSRLAVIQGVPASWAEEVCPRLAHHPSIVAWTAPAAELAELADTLGAAGAHSRPWIPQEIALGAGSTGEMVATGPDPATLGR